MIIKKEFDELMETSYLLSFGYELDSYKEAVITELNKGEIDGEQFYQQHLLEHEKFLQSFYKRCVRGDRDALLPIVSYGICAAVFLPIFFHRSLLKSFQGITKEALQKDLIHGYNSVFETQLILSKKPTTEELVKIIESMQQDAQSKWFLLTVLQDPISYYKRFVKMINDNIPAFHAACKEHAQYIDRNLKIFEKHIPDLYFKDGNYTVYPLISIPVSLMEFEDTIYCGTLIYKILNKPNNGMESDELALVLKVLADKTRLEILKLLKKGPSYNLEIAHKLSLSPATVSHHMTAFIIHKFVTIEKRGGYTYYHLNQDTLSSISHQINMLIL